MTRISLRSNFVSVKRKLDGILLDDEGSNLLSCLIAIEKAVQVRLVNTELGDIYPDIEVTVNGVDSNFLPEKLATRLREGDAVGVSLITMGGG